MGAMSPPVLREMRKWLPCLSEYEIMTFLPLRCDEPENGRLAADIRAVVLV